VKIGPAVAEQSRQKKKKEKKIKKNLWLVVRHCHEFNASWSI